MKRTTKALARLGTLAVIAGTVLGTPLAIGTANAAVGTITVTDGTHGSAGAAAADDNYPHDGQISIGNPDGDALKVQIGGTAYFEHNQPGGTFENSPTTATCSTSDDPCLVNVGDPAAETANFTVVDPSDAAQAQSKISFNGLFFTNCPGADIDTGEPGGTTYGNHNEPVDQNCVTQGQFGAGSQVVLTVHYGASDPLSTTNQNQGLNIVLHHIASDHSQISATQPSALTQKVDNNHATCTTDASGNCQIAVVNSGPSPIHNTDTERSYLEVDTNNSTGNFPHITSTPTSGAAPTERIRWGAGSVVPTRFNLVSSEVLGPDSQDNAGQQGDAEPGDAIQLKYEITGGCTPDTGSETCTGTQLAGIPATLTTDHGFFTPNCSSGGVIEYAGCSFTTAPANGVVVGNLTSSGTTSTVNTGPDGTLTVTVGIGRDTAFDQNGLITTHITDGALHSVSIGNPATPPNSNGRSSGTGCGNVHPDTTPEDAPFGGSITLPQDDECPIDFTWTTREEPLNGGTAKLIAIPAIAQPNNTAVQTENNVAATDSGTTNVPDVERVDFLVHETDQFGNLTAGLDGFTDGANSDAPTLTKTGPGWLWGCSGFSTTSACTGGLSGSIAQTAQPDGTVTQTTPNGVGSYLAVLNDLRPGGGLDGQLRGQLDTAGPGDVNLGYPCSTAFTGCTVSDQSTPGVNDGTTTLTLSWTPPVTKFTSVIAGSPISVEYDTTPGAAATDVYTINFYNQLAQPVVTFSVKPGNNVPTATAVTVAATVVDQFQNPIVNQDIDAVRSGANESSCTPAQGVSNGGNVENPLFTNTSGVAGYTFTCDAPGASTVTMVVVGPGGTQLATGKETVTFTGTAVKVKNETPSISKLTSVHSGHLTVHIRTHPALGQQRINIYRKLNGLYHLLGSVKTGHLGHATKHLAGLHRGKHYNIAVKAVSIGVGYNSHYSKHKGITIA